MSSSSRRRSRIILRAAWRTLRRNPGLLWFSALLAVATITISLAAVLLGVGGELAADPSVPSASVHARAGAGIGLMAWFAMHLVSPLVGVAAASATLEALAGRPWSMRASLGHAMSRIAAIGTFSVLDASVGGVLARLRGRDRKGRRAHPLLAQLLGMAWWAATYLVVPVLARENRGGLSAISRSGTLMRETWKEAFVGRLVLGWLVWPLVIAGALALGLLVLLGVDPGGSVRALLLTAAVSLPLFAVASAVLHTLDTIYRCALYVFATEGVVPEPFDDPDLHELWYVQQ
ncbi:MAG: hypothetical protein K1X88_34780 [Nannocystaceae bacterium]|nr:hypothetical protein [Nannocystaceae bacterium]